MTHNEAMIAALHEIIDLANTASCTWIAAESTVENYAALVDKISAIASNATLPKSAIIQATTQKWGQ